MRKVFLFLATIVAINFATAQNVNIPNVNFKTCLVGNTAINTNGDSEISVSEATAFTGEIKCRSVGGISDLTGLEAFVNLTSLILFEGPIYSEAEGMQQIDVSHNTALQKIQLTGNITYTPLQSVDLSHNPNLVHVSIESFKDLHTINLKNGNNTAITGMTGFERTFVALNMYNLSCIQVDDVAYSRAKWEHVTNPDVFSTTCAGGTSGIANLENANVKIYPNPAQNTVTVTGLKAGTELRITNLLGETIYTAKAQSETETISVAHLASGLYFLNNRKLVRE